jgi:hypothetical protein
MCVFAGVSAGPIRHERGFSRFTEPGGSAKLVNFTTGKRPIPAFRPQGGAIKRFSPYSSQLSWFKIFTFSSRLFLPCQESKSAA